MQIAPTLGSKVYKCYLLWPIWSPRDRAAQGVKIESTLAFFVVIGSCRASIRV